MYVKDFERPKVDLKGELFNHVPWLKGYSLLLCDHTLPEINFIQKDLVLTRHAPSFVNL